VDKKKKNKIKLVKRWYLTKGGRNLKYSLELINPEKEGKMSYFKINCPFCEGNSVSDVIDSIEEVDGQWECSNGHQFVIKYLGKIE